uniref:Secreted protein n=1 Tax=Rhipicephalus zambeziensis TaxID=60191 RepID=A0A224YE21_9ACAR
MLCTVVCVALHNIALAAHEPALEGGDDNTDDTAAPPAAAGLPPLLVYPSVQQQCNRVANQFRGPWGPHTERLHWVHCHLQRPWQHCAVPPAAALQ